MFRILSSSQIVTLRGFTVNRLADVGQRVLVVLLDQAFRFVVEMFDREIAPPFVQVAVLVEESAFVVEAVGQLHLKRQIKLS